MNILARKPEPAPMTPARNMAPTMPRNLNPSALQHVSDYSDTLDELDRLREDNQTMRNDLEVERRTNAELRKLLSVERCEKERHMRYSVSIKTRLGGIAQLIIAANEEAMDCAEQEPPQPAPQTVTDIEEAIGKVIAEGVVKEGGAQ